MNVSFHASMLTCTAPHVIRHYLRPVSTFVLVATIEIANILAIDFLSSKRLNFDG